MTETVSGPAARKGRRGKGLKMRRINTTAGVHPYEQVTWERRDVVMTNWRDGSINFEQHGVEFPEFWSVNAGNIVTTKYFRGAVGTPQREWSLKQLVDRVTDVYTKTGVEHGYFASDEDAEIFDHELKYALVHQIFSFNSPVWFNVGTAASQQVSACFILAVDDTIESIESSTARMKHALTCCGEGVPTLNQTGELKLNTWCSSIQVSSSAKMSASVELLK